MAASEPIVARLQVLSDLYGEFAEDSDARILRFLLAADEVRMVEAFIAMEQDEQAGQHGDLLLEFTTPFDNPHGHGYLLRKELVAAYRNDADAIEASGTDAAWQPPHVKDDEADVPFLLRTAESFIAHYGLPGNLVIVLRPEAVADPVAYQQWLHRLAAAAQPNVRVMLLDLAERPFYGELTGQGDRLTMTQQPALDMPGALEEISQAGGNLDTPGGQFRHLFVQLGNALGAAELPKAQGLAKAALEVAASQGWHHMQVPVRVAMAAALAGAGQYENALAEYDAAEQAAVRGESEGPEEAKAVCPTLRLNTRLGKGSTLVAAGAWAMAAQLYEETVPLAEALKDARSLLDCYRLASFCREQEGRLDEAFRLGALGLDKAREFDKETLSTSTFPYLGESLMRLAETGPRRALRQRVEEEIVAIAGTRDWRPAPPSGSPAGQETGPSQ